METATEIENEEGNTFWVSVSDLMAGTMLIFALLALIYIQKLNKTRSIQEEIFKMLAIELKKAGIAPKINPKDGTIEFSDKIFFQVNKYFLSKAGAEQIGKFIPILAKVIFEVEGAEKEIISIDIEGHTSQNIKSAAFIQKMMELSVNRSLAVWKQVQKSNKIPSYQRFNKLLRVAGRGNMLSSTTRDVISDRKVVFKLQFSNPINKLADTIFKRYN
ncbi:MAG: hypothetical protein ISR65_09655 [Bacteriovoracaceae bacterium]|nr:hypothetical protein [Bacteriovoracaceae bacterium]